MTRVSVIALAVAMAPALGAAPPAGTVDTHVVRIDVVPSDSRGRIIETLKASDFELRENGVVQTLDQITLIKVDRRSTGPVQPIESAADERAQAAEDGTRLFAIFLDEYHVAAGEASERVRQMLARFVDEEIGPRDLVAVMKPLDSLLTIRTTRDREAIRQAIATFEGRKGDYAPRNDFERTYVAGTPEHLEQIRAQIATSALNALSVHLGGLSDRRKTVVLVSEGFGKVKPRRGYALLPTFDSVIRSANRFNVAIYSINPADPGDATDMLQALADETDGRAVTDGRTVEAALRRVGADASEYYLLTYRSQHPDDGLFREVEVKVNKPGVTVRARKGYWALFPDEAFAAKLIAEPEAAKKPVPLEPPRHISTMIRPWFGTSRGENGKTRVSFVWEPVLRAGIERLRRPEASRLVLKAVGADDTAVFEGTVMPVAVGDVDSGAPGALRATFEVPPGRVKLSMSIQDATSRVIDSDVRDLSIRDLRVPVAIGTPEVFRTRTAREFRAISTDAAAVPVASRQFSRTEHILVRFAPYAPADSEPVVTAKLLNRTGQQMRELQVVDAPAAGERQIELPLAGLAPSDYLIELDVACSAGTVKELLPFRVTT